MQRQFSQIQPGSLQCQGPQCTGILGGNIVEICGNACDLGDLNDIRRGTRPGIVPWEAMETTPKFFVEWKEKKEKR